MHDIVEFLSRHEPFDALPEDGLEDLSTSVEVEFFGAGETVFRQGEGPLQHVWVVRRGQIELTDSERVLDVLGEGELFGHRWTLAGLPIGIEARAAEDTLLYRLPADRVMTALARPAGLRYLAETMHGRSAPGVSTGVALDPVHQPVAQLVNGSPIIGDPDWTVRETAQRMDAAGDSAALVRVSDQELGIVTDSDLRARVVAGGVAPDAPVTEVMSSPAFTVTPERYGADVMLEMLDRNIRHIPVVWPHGEVVGILSDRDLLVTESRSAFVLRRAIEEAASPEELRRAAAQLRPAIIGLHHARISPAEIASVIAVVVDALTRRLIQLQVSELGPPPRPLMWLALGSLGRREAVLSSDLDSGLVWEGEAEDAESPPPYFLALGRRVVAEMAACGFSADSHGANPGQALFNSSAGSWRLSIRDAVNDPEQGRALVFLSLMFDGRLVHGIGEVRNPLEELRQIWHHRTVLRLMLRLALSRRPPTGFQRLRDPPREFVVEHSGEHQGRLNIKQHGLIPIEAIARYVSLRAHVHTLSTKVRLDAAATAGVIPAKNALALTEAHDLFWELRLEHQVGQLSRGEDPDDYIDVKTMDPANRRHTRDAFRAVSAVQRSLRGELSLPP
jgi:CBS domain-containing protein